MNKRLVQSLLVVVVLAVCWACGSETSTSSYQGLGSKWTASFTGGSAFTLTYDAEPDGTVDMTVNGTYVEYTNNFRLLTVTSATGTNAPAAGETAYGLEIPGFAFFLKPVSDANAEPIVMVSSGSCPTTDFTANWIKAKYEDSTTKPTASSDAFGQATFTLTGATKTSAITQRRFDTGATIGSPNTITMTTCTNGAQGFDDGNDGGTMYLTSNGGALVNPGDGIIFASPQMTADVTSTDWDGTYSGLVFNESQTDKVFPAKIILSGTGGTGAQITDVENDTASAGSVTFASLTAVTGTKGQFRGTVDGQPINCTLSSVAGKKLLGCNGAAGAAVSGVYPSFFFLGSAR